MKTNKSFQKRLKVTAKGKVLARKPNQNHFNAKESRTFQLHKKRWQSFNIRKKELKKYLPYD